MSRYEDPAETAASALGDFLDGYGPDARAGLLDALKADLDEGGSISVTFVADEATAVHERGARYADGKENRR